MPYFGTVAAVKGPFNPGFGNPITSSDVPSSSNYLTQAIALGGSMYIAPDGKKYTYYSTLGEIVRTGSGTPNPDGLLVLVSDGSISAAAYNNGNAILNVGKPNAQGVNTYAAYVGNATQITGIRVWSYDTQGNPTGYTYSLNNVTKTVPTDQRFICSVTSSDGVLLFKSAGGTNSSACPLS